jgi:hypothetical protein
MDESAFSAEGTAGSLGPSAEREKRADLKSRKPQVFEKKIGVSADQARGAPPLATAASG